MEKNSDNMENIIEFPAKEAGANKTIASEVELAQAVGNRPAACVRLRYAHGDGKLPSYGQNG